MTVSDLIEIIYKAVYFNKCRLVFDKSFVLCMAVISCGSCGAVHSYFVWQLFHVAVAVLFIRTSYGSYFTWQLRCCWRGKTNRTYNLIVLIGKHKTAVKLITVLCLKHIRAFSND